MKIKILLLTIICFSIRCEKPNQTLVSGKVIDPISKKSIIGAAVALLNHSKNGDYQIVEICRVDSLGNYEIKTSELVTNVSLESLFYNYITSSGEYCKYPCSIKDITLVKNNSNINFLDLSPGCLITINLKVSQPIGTNDSINIKIYDEYLKKVWFSKSISSNLLLNQSSFEFDSDIRAKDSMLISISKYKSGIYIYKQFRHYFDIFWEVDSIKHRLKTDTINITF